MSDLAFSALCHALELAIVAPCGVMALMPVRPWLNKPLRVVYAILAATCAVVVVVGSAICVTLDWASYWTLALFLPVLAGLFCNLVSLSPGKSLFALFNAAMLGGFSFVYVNILVAPMEAGNVRDAVLPASSLLCLALAVLLGEMFHKLLAVKLPTLYAQQSLDWAWTYAWLLPLGMTLLFAWMSPETSLVVAGGRVREVSLVTLVLIPAGLLLLYEVVWRMSTSLLTSARLRQENDMLQMEEKRYQEMRSYMARTRELRHDFRHHLLAIDELARSGKNDELCAYIQQLSDVAGEGNRQLCANGVLDAVASHYDALAVAQQTRIDWALELPEEMPFSNTDLCSVLGNLVENAIHAVAELPEGERAIDVSARMLSDEMLGITVRNPYRGFVKLNRRGLPTTSREGHGIGLASVASIVRSYQGTLSIQTDNGRFVAGVLMYARESQD